MLERLENHAKGINLGDYKFPRTVLWVVIEDKVIGEVSVRNLPEEVLLDSTEFQGAHIGYKIKPSERGKGYATQACKIALDYCRDVFDLKRVLISCNEDNLASKRVIEKNGGIEIEPFVTSNGEKKLRFWVYSN